MDLEERFVVEKTLAGPVLEGDIDRALSANTHTWSVQGHAK